MDSLFYALIFSAAVAAALALFWRYRHELWPDHTRSSRIPTFPRAVLVAITVPIVVYAAIQSVRIVQDEDLSRIPIALFAWAVSVWLIWRIPGAT